MRNLKLVIQYEGTNYCGWQVQNGRQANKPSVQKTLERFLSQILQEKINLIGSGRTDAGVHALAQVVNFKTSSLIPVTRLRDALNALLPDDIVILKVEDAPVDFHSRFSAKSKIYRYTILNRAYPDAFLYKTSYFFRLPLDVRFMRQEARVLVGKHDFKAFKLTAKLERSSVRVIKRLKIRKEKGLIHIEIEANGFLYNMARNIAGTLIEVGKHKLQEGDLKRILVSKDRRLAGPTALARGLSLVRVKY